MKEKVLLVGQLVLEAVCVAAVLVADWTNEGLWRGHLGITCHLLVLPAAVLAWVVFVAARVAKAYKSTTGDVLAMAFWASLTGAWFWLVGSHLLQLARNAPWHLGAAALALLAAFIVAVIRLKTPGARGSRD